MNHSYEIFPQCILFAFFCILQSIHKRLFLITPFFFRKLGCISVATLECAPLFFLSFFLSCNCHRHSSQSAINPKVQHSNGTPKMDSTLTEAVQPLPHKEMRH